MALALKRPGLGLDLEVARPWPWPWKPLASGSPVIWAFWPLRRYQIPREPLQRGR